MISALLKKLDDIGVKAILQDGRLSLDAPKGALTDELMAELKNHKAALIEHLVQQPDLTKQHNILRRPSDQTDNLPTTFSQKRFWLLNKITEGSHAYNVYFAWTIEGPFSIVVLKQALVALIDRHESLRTHFKMVDRKLFQQIMPAVDVILNEHGLVDESEAAELGQRLSETGFDLTEGPIFSCHVWKQALDQHVFMFVAHHIAVDAQSMNILKKELASLYVGYLTKQTSRLLPVEIHYADYAIWENNHQNLDLISQQLNYWVAQLSSLPVLALPNDFPSIDYSNFEADQVTLEMNAEDRDRLNQFAKNQQTTLFHIFLAAIDILLANFCQQQDIVLGTPVAGRGKQEIENAVGCFINTLVLRSKLSSQMSFVDLLENNKEMFLNALSNQEVPFEQVVTAVAPKRDPNQSPLFQAFYSFAHIAKQEERLGEARIKPYVIPTKTADYDFSVFISSAADQLSITLQYKKARFMRQTIEKLLHQYDELLKALIASPHQHLGLFGISLNREHALLQVADVSTDTLQYVPPRNALEELVIAVWQDELQAAFRLSDKKIGVNDNFFDLGGDSIIAIQVISQLSEKGYQASVSQLFDHQTVRSFAKAIVLKNNKPAVVVESKHPSGFYSLSPMQEGLFFHHLYDSKAYFMQLRFTIVGELRPELFHQAWQKIFERHPILRHGFMHQADSSVMQYEVQNINLPWKEFRIPEQQDEESYIQQYLMEDANHPFDLEKPPLMRCALFFKNAYQMVWSFHHVLLDGWSISLILDEVRSIYHALLHGNTAALPQLPLYSTFIHWIASQDMHQAEQYWVDLLKGLTTVPTLSFGPAPEKKSKGHRRLSDRLTLEQSEKVFACAKEMGITISTLLQTLWGFLLTRYSGKNDVLFGSVTSGRPAELPKSNQMVGLFINTIPVRVKFTMEDLFCDLLKRVAKQLVTSREYEYCSLSQIKRWTKLSDAPALFDTLFVYENYPSKDSLNGQGKISFEEYAMEEQTHYPLTILAEQVDQQLAIRFNYNESKLASEHAAQMFEHYLLLLGQVDHLSNATLNQLPLITTSDWAAYEKLNKTQRCVLQGTVYEHFFEQAKRFSDKTALIDPRTAISYATFLDKIDRIATLLTAHGVKRHDLVALMADRGIEMLVSVMAILRLGAGYVPLDPKHPKARLLDIMEDSKPRLILCVQETLLFAVLDLGVTVLRYDENHLFKNALIPYEGQPSDTAYVIYTSGSTGKPKGVDVPNACVLNYISWYSETFYFDHTKISDFSSSLSFDLSITTTLAPLVKGGTIAICDEDTRHQVSLYLEHLRKHAVTHFKCTPSYFSCLLSCREQVSALEKLEYITLGGEVVSKADLKRWFSYNPRQKIVNGYGPTETTVVTVAYVMDAHNLDRYGDLIPIGSPVFNTELFILDANGYPAPRGVLGELYIAGSSVTKGYLNNPQMTAERFARNPLFSKSGRLYKTGDIVSLMDNQILYTGRIDDQIKLRGFRIEVDEIVSRLLSYPGIKHAVVLVQSLPAARQRLVAFCITEKKGHDNVKDILKYVAQSLPEYMVPSHLVFVEALPMNVNGKLDKPKLLSLIDDETMDQAVDSISPQYNAVQQTLLSLWSEILSIPRNKIHLDASFFELGGDSIMSIQLMAKLRQQGLVVSPRVLFENPTIGLLSAYLDKGSHESVTYLSEQAEVIGEIKLTPIQRWFFSEVVTGVNHYNQSFIFKVPSSTNASAWFDAFKYMVMHHDALRMRFRQGVQYNQSIQAEKDQPSFQAHYLDFSAFHAVEAVKALEMQNAKLQTLLDIEKGPLTQIALYQLPNKEMRLFVTIHHLVVDGVSWRILLEDWAKVYQNIINGNAVALPAKTTSYRQWSALLSEYAQRDAVKKEAEFWNKQLDIDKTRESLMQDFRSLVKPTVKARHEISESRKIIFTIPLDRARVLFHEGLKFYKAQINDVLLAALLMTLQTCGYQGDSIIVDLEGHGREDVIKQADLSRTIGWFTSIFPVRFVLAQHSLYSMVAYVKSCLNQVPHKGIGYGVLRYLAGKNEKNSQVKPIRFNYLGQFLQDEHEESLFKPAKESEGQLVSDKAPFHYLMDVNALLNQDGLTFDWAYSSAYFDKAVMAKIAQHYTENLDKIIQLAQNALQNKHYLADEFFRLTPEALIPMKTNTGGPAFFCVHPGGGTVDRYLTLATRLTGVDFYGLQDPSILDIGRYFKSMEDMASCYIHAMKSVQPHGPYLIGGWSYGGTVAYEMALQLTQSGEKVALLAMLDAWNMPEETVNVDEFDIDVYRALMARGGVQVSEELILNMQITQRQRSVLRKNYCYPRSHLNIVLFRSEDIAPSSPFDLYRLEAFNRWEQISSGKITVHAISGDHFTLMDSPNVDVLAAHLNRILRGEIRQ